MSINFLFIALLSIIFILTIINCYHIKKLMELEDGNHRNINAIYDDIRNIIKSNNALSEKTKSIERLLTSKFGPLDYDKKEIKHCIISKAKDIGIEPDVYLKMFQEHLS